MKRYLLIFFLWPLLSKGQSNYKSGYVVTGKGDTLHGYINLKEWDNNPKDINFKLTLNDKTNIFGIHDIRYFKIGDIIEYQRCLINISLNPVDLSSPPSLLDTSSRTDTVFLKVLQKGKNLTLYSYKDYIKPRFYIKENGVDLVNELFYGVYEGSGNSNSVIVKNTFRDQLSQSASKYKQPSGKLAAMIMQANYSEDDLMSVVAQINEREPQSAVLKSPRNAPVRFFVGGAFISSTLQYSANGPFYGAPPSTSGSPKVSIGVDAITNPDVGHLVFRMELGYAVNHFNENAQPNPLYNLAEPTVTSLKLKQNVIFITPQIIYNIYNANSLKVFLDLGYSFNVVSYQSVYITTEYLFGKPVSSSSQTDNTNSGNFKGNYSAVQLKAGVVFGKRIEIYGAWFTGAEITNSLNYTTNLSSYQLGLNLFIGKIVH